MRLYALSAIGRDRPGIVAAISGVLLELDGNLEDSQMSILRGHFAVMLIVALPESLARAELERRLEAVRAELGLEAIAISSVDELDESGPAATHVLTVYGADHPGIVHAVSSALAGRGITITGLETRLTGAERTPIYVLMMEIAAGADVEELASELREIGEREGLDVSIRPRPADAL